MFDLRKALHELQMESVLVEKITVKNVKRTDPKFLDSFFNSLKECNSLPMLQERLSSKIEMLTQLGFIRDCEVFIVTLPENKIELVLQLKERKFSLNTGTFVSPKSGGLSVGSSGTIFNMFGRGEQLRFESSIGSTGKAPLSIFFVKPLDLLNGGKNFNVDIFKRTHQLFGSSSGIELKYSVLNGMHQFGYGLVWKEGLLCSSLSYALEHSTQNSQFLPSSGHYLKGYLEFTGLLGGQCRFAKSSLLARYSFPLPLKETSICSTLKIGALLSLNSQIPLMDKFASSQNGFGLVRGRTQQTTDYGNFLIETGLSVYFPLSLQHANSLKGYLFINGGQLTSSIKFTPFNWYYGVGIASNVFGNARMEINCAFPIGTRPSNFLQSFQLGLGLEFL